VITVLEGDVTHRELEKEFNVAFGDSWRCTARSLGPNQYIMRFPTAVEVERAVYYGAKMHLKTVDATVRLSTWTASIGAKAVLQKAWVKVSNIPLDKRCDANVFYAGGLVGVSLELDPSTLHKPEYVRVLIGCRDVEMIPASAEGCLGDNFYDFFYEIDKIVVGGPPKTQSSVAVGGHSGAPSPKRARYDQNSNLHEESSEEQNLGSQSDTVGHTRKHDDVVVPDANTESDSQEDDEAGSSELLIESMTREHEAKMAASQVAPPAVSQAITSNKWLTPCPILQENKTLSPMEVPLQNLLLPYTQNLPAGSWPPLPTITEMAENSSSPPAGSPAYIVQSPDSASMEEDKTIPEDTRCSTRLADNVNMDIMEKVSEAARKRDLEGMSTHSSLPVQNSFAVLSNDELVLRAQKLGVHIPDNNFSSVDMLRDLENARSELANKNVNKSSHANTLFIEDNTGEKTPLSMDWADNSDNENAFVIVESRKKRSARKKPVVVCSRPNTRSRSNVETITDNKSAQNPGRVVRAKNKPSRFK
jgi:hypothetical protein